MISLVTPQRKWASSRLEGRTSLIFSSCGRCSRHTTGTSGTHYGGLRKGQSPCEFLGGLSGFLSRRYRGLRPCVESVPEPEHSSPVLTWNFEYFWSLHRGVSPHLELGHSRALSSRAVAAVSLFPLSGSRNQWLSLEAFPRGSSTCHHGGIGSLLSSYDAETGLFWMWAGFSCFLLSGFGFQGTSRAAARV